MNAKTATYTQAQQAIIDRMMDGWTLSLSKRMADYGRHYLTLGGQREKVSSATADALLRNRRIAVAELGNLEVTFKLTLTMTLNHLEISQDCFRKALEIQASIDAAREELREAIDDQIKSIVEEDPPLSRIELNALKCALHAALPDYRR